ncbi:MAG: hypothetical protein LBH29_00490, partial [Elusimicrobiota bacterium]|nr:hypothetical protein [Elusimicrobiota bacterium]
PAFLSCLIYRGQLGNDTGRFGLLSVFASAVCLSKGKMDCGSAMCLRSALVSIRIAQDAMTPEFWQ